MNDTLQRMQALIEKILEANYQYYSLDNPTISDKEWDLLYDELRALEKTSGIVLENSPTKQVGGKTLKIFAPHTHIQRLYSMDKVQSLGELEAWLSKNQKIYTEYCAKHNLTLPPLRYTVEYKLDGLTLNLTYQDGILTQAATRGNGITGEAVLQNAETIQSIPRKIAVSGTMEIQGECILRLSVLEAYNKSHTEVLKNARNAAAGAIRNLDPKVTAERNLDAYFYAVGFAENAPFATQMELITFLRAQGFDTSPFLEICEDFAQIEALIEQVDAARSQLDFLIDGVVIKINDIQTREIFGYTDKFPKWAVAYKFEAEETTTRLLNVTWEVGRTGKLTPLAHLEKVDIGGVSVSKATLNNYGDIQKKHVKLGCTVWVRRSNDVIPEILGRVIETESADEQEILPPTHCPACHRALYEEGAHLFCPGGVECAPQAIARIAHFSSRDAMDIEGLSNKTAEALYQKKLLRRIDDIYRLTMEDLLSLDKVKEKKASRLLSEIERSKTPELSRFVFALGISNIGKKTAKDLASHFQSFQRIRSASYEELISVSEIGDIVANSILDYFADSEQQAVLESMFESGIRIQEERAVTEGRLHNQSIVLTGTLPKLSRKEAEALISQNGGRISSSVSKNTAFVLLGENPGSKYDKAVKLGIPTYSEEAFLEMLK